MNMLEILDKAYVISNRAEENTYSRRLSGIQPEGKDNSLT